MDTPALSRRDTLKVFGLGAAALVLPYRRTLSAGSASRIASSKLPQPYTMPFRQPAVVSPGATYTIRQEPVLLSLLPDSSIKTPLFAYNGSVPGPTLKVRRDHQVAVRVENRLPARHPTLGYVPSTSIHLHGSPSKPQYDGYASDLSMPGQYKTYLYPNTCTARTLWYHDHAAHHTAHNVYLGLAGQYHVSDPVEDAAAIPKGRYDVPLTISDAMFAENGALLYDDDSHSGLWGDVILVNGTPWPRMPVEQRTYRLRLLNASISRGYRLRLSNGQPFWVVATDGGLLDVPQQVTELKFGMAERYEIVCDFRGLPVNQSIDLVNRGVKNSEDYDHTDKVMRFTASGPATDTSNDGVPVTNAPKHPVMALTADQATATRHMRLERGNGMWTVSGQTWRSVAASGFTQMFANPPLDGVEIWEAENRSGGWFHPLHIHLIDFQVLSRNGRPPARHELGPKDVVYLGENETVRLLMRFGPHQGRYMIHCHNLPHEDEDMMTQFQVGENLDDPMTSAPPQPL